MLQDNTTKWRVRKLTTSPSNEMSAFLPLGHTYFSFEPNVPTGKIPAFGGLYDRTLYADLWLYANAQGLVISETEWQSRAKDNGGSCSYYSDGNGSTTFRVPALKCWAKGANGIEEVGSYLEAGLPNIAGTAGYFNALTDYEYSGAMYEYDQRYTRDSDAGSTNARKIGFDASRSNAIYGNSDTVQPPSIVGMWLIVAFGIAHNIGEADVANVMQAVEQVQTGFGKVEEEINNLSFFGFPDYSAGVQKTSGTQYTAETDGYIMAQTYRDTINGWAYITVTINGTELPCAPQATDYGSAQMYLPIKKGDVYKITVSSNLGWIYFFPMRA